MRRLFYALGDAQLRRWMAAGRPLARADGGGLTFTLSANGTASWVMRYSRGQRRRELTIGQYPDLRLDRRAQGGTDPKFLQWAIE
jgi:hypothetical protein